jgi:hypothetical protein
MKQHAHSLEEERQALLEQIHASRDAYRRMLRQSDTAEEKNTESVGLIGKGSGFPRSMTVRWIMQHPYLCAAVATALVVAAPLAGRALATRRTAASANPAANRSRAAAGDPIRTRRTARTRSTDMAGSSAAPAAGLVVAGRAAITGLATAAMMILRDPAKMRMAGRLLSTITGFVQARRAQRR